MGRSLCSGNGPCVPAAREGFHTPREHPGNFHMAFPPRLLCRSELESLGLSAPCSALADRTPWAPTWNPGLGALLAFFCRGALMGGSPETACKSFPWLLLPPARASFAPCSATGHTRGRPATPHWGPMGGARCPQPGDTGMATGPLRHIPTASFPMGQSPVPWAGLR